MESDGHVDRVGSVVVVGVAVRVDIHDVRRVAGIGGSSPPVSTSTTYQRLSQYFIFSSLWEPLYRDPCVELPG